MNTRYEQAKESAKGFTIIEVVLVLAIAGLIFLMVFIALPALQRGQRDGQRKEDLSRVNVQMQNFSGASRGSIPDSNTGGTFGTFVKKYLGGTSTSCAGSEYRDPSKTSNDSNCDNYKIIATNNADQVPQDGEIIYQPTSKCKDDGSGNATTGSPDNKVSARNYTLRILLEGQTAAYCIDNR